MKSEKTQCVRTKKDMCWANIALLSLALCCGNANAFVVKKLCEGKTNPSVEEANVYRLICDENYDQTGVGQELEQVDMILNGYYKAARERSSDKEALLKTQKAWLKERNTCKDVDCLRRAFHQRIMELAAVPAKAEILYMTAAIRGGGVGYILTRENGLKHFDGGKSDFDIAIAVAEIRQEKNQISKCSEETSYKSAYYLVGTGVAITTRCQTSEYGVFKPAITEGGKSFQLFVAYRPNDEFITYVGDARMLGIDQIVDADTSGQFWPRKSGVTNTDEPFRQTINRVDKNGKTIWEWVAIAKKTVGQSAARYSLVRIRNWTPLPDGSIFSADYGSVAFRLDPNTGMPYNKDHFRVFSVDQAIAWRQSWAQDYLKQMPNCQGDIRRCPDKKAASDYLFMRFDEEMARQFGDLSRQ